MENKNTDNLIIKNYQISLNTGELKADPFQQQVILELQQVYNTLLRSSNIKSTGFFNHFFSRETEPLTKKGLYLWGGVGRGKTLLVDYFFNLVPLERKLRLHFHRFMQLVHEELGHLKHAKDPLKIVAKKLSKRIDLLCLDEIHVNDIADAMLLGTLFDYLFANEMILVTTSNSPPHELYKGGLQRERFIPAIRLLEQQTKIVKMGGDEDYRLKMLKKSTVYHISSTTSEHHLQDYFHQLVGIERHKDRTNIIIKQRSISVKMWADGVVWFSFDHICNTVRSTEDYIQIATIFHTVLISNIPIMDSSMDDIARRFVNMIDEFYDLQVNLVTSAHTSPEKLYSGTRLIFEFERTVSRLHEMQSAEYLSIKHLS